MAAAYQRASQHNPVWRTIDPQAYIHFIHDKIFATFDPVGEWANERLLALKVVHQIWTSIRGAYCSSEAKEQSSGRRLRFRSWQAIDLTPRFLLVALVLIFLAYLLYAASRFGTFDAQKLLSGAEERLNNVEEQPKEAQGPENGFEWLVGHWNVIHVPLLQRDEGATTKSSRGPRGIFVVPTENLASLDFSDCPGETDKEHRLFSRANFRQDAGDDSRHGTPECLLRLGSLGRWQFLADIQDGEARKQREIAHVRSREPRDPVIFVVNNGDQSILPRPENGPVKKDDQPFVVVFDGRTGAVSTPACKLELAAVIGPFPTGEAELQSNSTLSEPPGCKIEGKSWKFERIGRNEQGDFPAWQGRLIENPSRMVVLVGRADVRPISNGEFSSNMNLATERTIWVRKELIKSKSSLRISSITGGPADSEPNDNPCSRIVEVHTCPADQAASKDA